MVAVIGWFFLDIFLRVTNKSSNDEMMPDIMEMSRSVLYAKRGGQYIADALKDAVIVVENKRLKTALMQLRNDMDSGRNLDECLQEMEMSFSNGEISSFCTVIKSLQTSYSGVAGTKSIRSGSVGSVRTPDGAVVRETSAYGKVKFDIKNIIDGSFITKSKDIYCTLEINN